MRIQPTLHRSACRTTPVAWEPSPPLTDKQAIRDRLAYNDRVQEDLLASMRKQTQLGYLGAGAAIAGVGVQIGSAIAGALGARTAVAASSFVVGAAVMGGGLFLTGKASDASLQNAIDVLCVHTESERLQNQLNRP